MVVERIVLAIDVGSSSVRCSAYRINHETDDRPENLLLVEALEDCNVKKEARVVQPNTGRIIIEQHYHAGTNGDGNKEHNDTTRTEHTTTTTLFDLIDSCVDDTLKLLRERSKQQQNNLLAFDILGVGFSTLVMNLIGVDHNGDVIGEAATMSYACNSLEATNYCQTLKRYDVDHYYNSKQQCLYSLFSNIMSVPIYIAVNWVQN
jgi:sugar (pentulose or hexulose) kinase